MDRLILVVGAGAALFAASSLAGRIRIVSEDQAARSWSHAPDRPRVVAGYPAAATDKGRDVCINIGYLIKSDGSTSDYSQMAAWSSDGGDDVQAYVQVAAAAVSMWRFVPAAGKAHPMYTSASFAFAGSKALPPEDIRSRCRIADLPGHVQQAQVAMTNKRWIFRRSDKLRPSDESAISPNWIRPDGRPR